MWKSKHRVKIELIKWQNLFCSPKSPSYDKNMKAYLKERCNPVFERLIVDLLIE